MHASTCVCTCTHGHEHMLTRFTQMHTHTHTHIGRHARTHARTHKRIQTYSYAQARALTLAPFCSAGGTWGRCAQSWQDLQTRTQEARGAHALRHACMHQAASWHCPCACNSTAHACIAFAVKQVCLVRECTMAWAQKMSACITVSHPLHPAV